MAFSAITAVVAGATDFATVATAVAEVGTTLSVVGAVTGNSTLTKVGGIMGLAGGAGALASGALSGTLSEAADLPPSFDPTTGNEVSDAASQAANLAVPAISGGATPELAHGADAADAANFTGAADHTGLNSGATPLAVSSPDSGVWSNASLATADSGAAPGMAGSAPDGAAGVSAPNSGSIVGTINGTPAGTLDGTLMGNPAAAGATGLSPSLNPNLNFTPAQGAGDSANLATQANLPAVMPAAGVGAPNQTISNDILDTGSAQGGTSYGTGAGTNGATAGMGSGNWFSGLTNWAEANPHAANGLMQLGGGIASGMGKAYEADRNYQLGLGQLSINRQKQANANSQVATGGIINTARNSANRGA
ncbi:MAG: hypothetical protein ACHP7O_01030 [Burkholderiales bacterium]